jgi:outer membrane protein assembly factor BamB
MVVTMSRMTRFLSCMTAILFIAGCGGGGGGGGGASDGGSSTVTPPNPTASLSISSTTLDASATIAQPAPTAGFSVSIASAATSTTFYLKGSYTKHGIVSVTESGTTGDFTIEFQLPATLGVGTYQDTVTIEACYDSACSQRVSNSPQTISVTYAVTPGPGTLTSLSPATVQAGVAFTLTVNGSGFNPSSVVIFNGNPVPTTFVSVTQLTASITASAIAQPDPYTVVVAPSSAGASSSLSNQLILAVSALPSVTGLTPSSIVAGSADFTLTVTGTNFPQGAVVLFGGTPLPTTWIDNNQLTATVTSAQVLNAGAISVTVATSAASDALVSAPVSFTVQPLPALASNSIDPSIATAGGPAFVLTVLGQGFLPSAVVNWNGTALQTTYVSELELQAQVPASDIVSTGTATITVQNSTAAGGTTAPLTLKIAAAAPDAVSLQITPDHAGAISFKSLSFPTTSTWSVNVGGTPSYALIVDGKVIVTAAVNNNTQLIALNQATGATVWGPIEITGSANTAYDGGKVFVLSSTVGGQGTVQSYDIETGTLAWTVTLSGGIIGGGLTALNGMIYTSSDNGLFFALREDTGSVAWSAPVLNGGFGTPAVTSTGVYASYPCSTYDFQPLTGTQLFFTSTGCEGGGGATPVVANGLVFSPAGNSNGGGLVVDASSGTVMGTYTATGEPAFSATTGYFLQSGTLNALTSSNNTVIWSFTGDGLLSTSPLVVNQAVIVGSSSGNVYALDAATGQQLWTVNAGGALQPGSTNSGLAAGDGLLIVPAGNQVVAYTLSTNP